MKKIDFDKKRIYEWLIISESYFECALMNARILKEKLENTAPEGSKLYYCLETICGDASQGGEYLIFPIIFNFRHGMELYLKAIDGITNSQFIKKHNLKFLFKEIKVDDEKIGDIIEKYTYCHLLLPRNDIPDKENVFERYPQDTPYDEFFNNDEIIEKITKDKIDELIKDIEFTYAEIRKISINKLKSFFEKDSCV